MNLKKTMFFSISLILTVIFSLFPNRVEEGDYIYGFPADLLIRYNLGPDFMKSHFFILGIIFNVVFFYFVLYLLDKIIKKMFRKEW